EVRQLPENTARQILALTRRGASITILGDWPRDVPGFPMPDIRRGTLFTTLQEIPESQILEGDDLLDLLTDAGVQSEPMSQLGLRFVRRSHREGHHYFIVNRSPDPVDEWVTLATPATSAILMDPRFLKRSGVTPIRQDGERSQVRLILEPGESRILRTFTGREAEGPKWTELTPSGNIRTIGGTWKVQFTEGGPELPDEFEAPILGSWTTLSDPRAVRFSGTARYTIDFEIPTEGNWLLDLGQVAHTAHVFVNGNDAGTAYTPPHQFDLSRFLRIGTNRLDIAVTNLPQPGPESNRPPSPSGLLGPVRLIPLANE
ncbi:glycosylhydrolase-like jelly roll fold domain-containing protein, partial [Haloferula sp.]|uniref:glycosylhydrolase-like jelly roll fold domain-containing protein n=1 Tax=Haloferula sp. TaxID=2497595 RepID=UPI003C74345B